jgi:hypothetical protein
MQPEGKMPTLTLVVVILRMHKTYLGNNTCAFIDWVSRGTLRLLERQIVGGDGFDCFHVWLMRKADRDTALHFWNTS